MPPPTEPLIWGQAGIPTATLWGGGLVAAVDGTRFVVPVRSIDARPNPKYFGRKKGVTWLNMINDQGVGTAGIVLSGTPRDSLYAVDLMYRREGGARPEVFISDTGSHSDMVFGLLKLLGVDYRPELAGLPDQRLWRTVRAADYGPLDTASRNLIDLEKIKRHWSDILCIAASVHAGEVAASEVMRILQRGGNPTQLGDALAHFGRIFKTLHVLSYVDREQYRRDIKRMRNLQEERHRLAKYICHGRRGELRERYHAGMEDQLGARPRRQLRRSMEHRLFGPHPGHAARIRLPGARRGRAAHPPLLVRPHQRARPLFVPTVAAGRRHRTTTAAGPRQRRPRRGVSAGEGPALGGYAIHPTTAQVLPRMRASGPEGDLRRPVRTCPRQLWAVSVLGPSAAQPRPGTTRVACRKPAHTSDEMGGLP
jgi:TnpA family transposase